MSKSYLLPILFLPFFNSAVFAADNGPSSPVPLQPLSIHLPSILGSSANKQNQIDIAPISAELDSNETKKDITITNQGSEPIIISTKATLQKDVLHPESANSTKELIVTPLISIIKPNATPQIFRAFIRDTNSDKSCRVYRIFFTQIPPKPKTTQDKQDIKASNATLSIGLSFGVPLYYHCTREEIEHIKEEREKMVNAKSKK